MIIQKISFESIPSTHTYAKECGASFNKGALTVIYADEQTNGYGQFQRPWTSPKGVNLYVSFYFHLDLKFRESVSQLTLLLAKTIKKVLEENGFSPTLKWPNDILLSEKKVAGVLCEVNFLPSSIETILSFGLNVNMEQGDLLKIDIEATSLKEESNQVWDREKIFETVLELFAFDLEGFKKLA